MRIVRRALVGEEGGEVKLHPIESDALLAVGYDSARSVLTVRFASGAIYEYFDVDASLYGRLIGAQPHPWSLYGHEVTRHRFREVD
jgi:hypothetical protein